MRCGSGVGYGCVVAVLWAVSIGGGGAGGGVCDPSVVARVGDQTWDVAAVGDVTVVASGRDGVDVFFGGGFALASRVALPGQTLAVEASGTHAFAAYTTADLVPRLAVIDFGDPFAAAVVADIQVAPAGDGLDLALVGTTLVYVNGPVFPINGRVTTISVSVPGAPTLLGNISNNNFSARIAVSNTHAYLTDTTVGIRILNFSNPSSITVAGSIPTIGEEGSSFADVAVDLSTNTLIAEERDPQFTESTRRVFTLGNPAAPTPVFSATRDATVEAIAARNGLLFVSEFQNATPFESGIRIISLAVPSAPDEIALAFGAPSGSLAATDQRLLGANGLAGLDVHNISTPSAPKFIGRIDIRPSSVGSLAASGSTLFIGQGNRVFSVDPDAPGGPAVLDFVDSSGVSAGGSLSVKGSIVYRSGSGTAIIDASDPADLTIVGGVAGNNINAVVGDHLYTASLGLLRSYDITNPSSPVAGGTASLPPGVPAVMGTNGTDLLVTGGFFLGASVFDLTNPGSPQLVSTIPTASFVQDAAFVDATTLLIAEGAGGLRVYDLSNPLAPSLVTTIPVGSFASRVAASGPLVAAGGNSTPVLILDLTDPLVPQTLGSVETVFVRDLLIDGGWLFIGDFFEGATIVDVSSCVSEPDPCPGDLTGDDAVNSDDLSVLLGAFGGGAGGDLNGDGLTNSDDLGVLLGVFGSVCE